MADSILENPELCSREVSRAKNPARHRNRGRPRKRNRRRIRAHQVFKALGDEIFRTPPTAEEPPRACKRPLVLRRVEAPWEHKSIPLQLESVVFTRPGSLVPGDPRISCRVSGRAAQLPSARAVGNETIRAGIKLDQTTQTESCSLLSPGKITTPEGTPPTPGSFLDINENEEEWSADEDLPGVKLSPLIKSKLKLFF